MTLKGPFNLIFSANFLEELIPMSFSLLKRILIAKQHYSYF